MSHLPRYHHNLTLNVDFYSHPTTTKNSGELFPPVMPDEQGGRGHAKTTETKGSRTWAMATRTGVESTHGESVDSNAQH